MTARQRAITWADPAAAAASGLGLDGLAYMRALVTGKVPLPPICALLGITMIEAAPGMTVLRAEPAEYHYNTLGIVHGGLAAALLDSCTGCAVHTTLPAAASYSTLEIKVNFVRPISVETGLIRAQGKVIHRGRTVATAEGRLTTERDGRLLAHATSTCLIKQPPAASHAQENSARPGTLASHHLPSDEPHAPPPPP